VGQGRLCCFPPLQFLGLSYLATSTRCMPAEVTSRQTAHQGRRQQPHWTSQQPHASKRQRCKLLSTADCSESVEKSAAHCHTSVKTLLRLHTLPDTAHSPAPPPRAPNRQRRITSRIPFNTPCISTLIVMLPVGSMRTTPLTLRPMTQTPPTIQDGQ
jgi:hypothetical protein